MLQQLIEQYAAGQLERSAFWRAMADQHTQLRDYSALIARSENLSAIEIDADDLVVRLENGLRFAWYPEEFRTAISALINHGEYEAEEMMLLTQAAKKSTTIIDVGANIGWYSLNLANTIKAHGGKIYCFEPVPSTIEKFRRNLALNPQLAEHVYFEPVGLSNTAKEVVFHIPKVSGSVAASEQILYKDDENRKEHVSLVRLDDFLADKTIAPIDLMKFDVEGAELFALEGALSVIQKDTPVIMLEMVRKWTAVYGYSPNDILAMLTPLGYQCWYVEGDSFAELTEMTETIQASNFFFLHPSKHGLASDYFSL